MGLSLGLAERAGDDDIAKAVWALLTDSTRRREMHSAGLMTIDGAGASRIAADLAQMLASRRGGKSWPWCGSARPPRRAGAMLCIDRWAR